MIQNSSFKYYFFVLSLLILSTSVVAQDNPDEEEATKTEKVKDVELVISGTFYFDGIRLDNVLVTLEADDEVIEEVRSDDNGKFKVTMYLDKIYLMTFSMDDYEDKMVEVDTRNVPNSDRKYDFYYKGWRVDMFPSELEVDYSSLKKPVAIVVYNPAEEGFSTDKKYERSVRPRREKLVKDVFDALDEKDMESEGAFDDYMLAVKDGDLFLKEGDYESALMQYEAAKEILPNESYPTKQIKKTMALMQANASVDEQYANHITTADEAFDNKEWELARTSYELAHDVKPKIEYPKDQIDLIIKNIEAEKLALIQMKEKERLAKYDAIVASGDSLKEMAMYPQAKMKYNDALKMYSKKEYPKTKIKEINTLLANNSKAEQEYANLLANANKYLNNREFEKAKTSYTAALGIRPDDEIPKAKLMEIDALLAGLAALEAKELQMEANRIKAKQDKYDGHIATADALMVDKSYQKAKVEYESALGLIPKEVYPTNQIKLINSTLAGIEGVDKQYEKLMMSGLKNQSTNKLEVAKLNYEAALALKPNEQAPKDAIASIDAKLASIAAGIAAKQKAIDDKYNGFIADGDANMALEKYTDAEKAYKLALTVKTKEDYPKSQLAVINDKLQAIALAAAASDKEAKELAAKELNYNQTIGKADGFYKQKNLVGAKAEYQKALLIFAGKAYPVSQISEIDAKLELLAADAAAKSEAEAALKAKQSKYQAIIVKADAALTAKDFVNARLEYQNAQKVFADKTYPANQIKKIEGLELEAQRNAEREALLLVEQAEAKKKFDKYVTEGDALISKGDLQKGKYKYEAALKLIPGDATVISKMRSVNSKIEEERELAVFHAKNDTEYNRQLAEKYPNGLNETTKKGAKTTTRIVIVGKGRGDEYKKEVYSYGAIFYFKNGKKIDATTFNRETKGH